MFQLTPPQKPHFWSDDSDHLWTGLGFHVISGSTSSFREAFGELINLYAYPLHDSVWENRTSKEAAHGFTGAGFGIAFHVSFICFYVLRALYGRLTMRWQKEMDKI